MVSFQTIALADTPAVSTEQMRKVDRMMVEDLGIDLVRMMENAGNHLAALAIDLFAPATVTVLVGTGGNGGGGLTAARHLSNRASASAWFYRMRMTGWRGYRRSSSPSYAGWAWGW